MTLANNPKYKPSALEVFLNVMRYINPRFTYLLTYPILAHSALHASSSGDVVVLRTRRRIGDRAFSIAAPPAWNRLPSADTAEADAVDHYFSSSAENIPVQFDDCFAMHLRYPSQSRAQYK